MITPEEEQLYYQLAYESWAPDRRFLEFGTWLGRSTTRICQGLEAAAPGAWELTCYDQFRWYDEYTTKAQQKGMPPAVKSLKDGDSFELAFLDLMGEFRSRIRTIQGRVADAPDRIKGAFKPDDRLAAVFVDASKGWENAALVRALAPYFADREHPTRVVFQDFFMNAAYNLHLLLMLLPALEPETYAKNGGSFVFRVAGKIDLDAFPLRAGDLKQVSESNVYQACDRLRASMPPERFESAALQISLPVILWHLGFSDAAEREVKRLGLSNESAAKVRARMGKHPNLAIPPLVAELSQA